jgi:hypothetical protein
MTMGRSWWCEFASVEQPRLLRAAPEDAHEHGVAIGRLSMAC